MSLGDDQILDLKDAIVAAFRPMENLFMVMGSVSVDGRRLLGGRRSR